MRWARLDLGNVMCQITRSPIFPILPAYGIFAPPKTRIPFTRKEPLMPDRRATRRLFSLFFILIATAMLAPAGWPALAAGRTTNDQGRTSFTPPAFLRVVDSRPTTSDQRPTLVDQRRATSDQRPTLVDQRRATNDQNPMPAQQEPNKRSAAILRAGAALNLQSKAEIASGHNLERTKRQPDRQHHWRRGLHIRF